jgi:membrane associated rhomboid family serine protease
MFFPIKDYNPTNRTAYLTIILIVINVLVFVYQAVVTDLDKHVATSAMIPWEITHLKNLEGPIGYEIVRSYGYVQKKPVYRKIPPLLTLFTSLFMHGSIMHLFGNMLFLWIFGNNIEDYLGRLRFIFFYFAVGLGASLVHILFHFNSIVPVIGASGAVSGIMGAYLILYPNARVRTLVFLFIIITFVDVPAFLFLIVWFIFQFFYVGGGSGIAWLAHVGGFVIGILLIKLMQRRPRIRPPRRRPVRIELIE